MPAGITENYTIGSLIRVRNRDWVVLPSDDTDILRLQIKLLKHGVLRGLITT